ncbi:hypothetical protein [Kitasatospora griseola]|uniref:hypothetical protein n=1 Tax=Kitasatospora griseola TaxID=2064 RepID=UPI003656F85E
MAKLAWRPLAFAAALAELPEIDLAFIEAKASRVTRDGFGEQGFTRTLNGVHDVAVGELVCRLGYGSKDVCDIRTTHTGNATWVTNGTAVFGSTGAPQNGGPVARTGDSGGPVITVNDPVTRQLNGMVVAGFGCTVVGDEQVCNVLVGWVDVFDVFDKSALRLTDRPTARLSDRSTRPKGQGRYPWPELGWRVWTRPPPGPARRTRWPAPSRCFANPGPACCRSCPRCSNRWSRTWPPPNSAASARTPRRTRSGRGS